ncbi:HIT family protein [Roseibium album]|uniref:HIT family protein n=1 Tax=Roseibium album TaxID=311410 RepID=UPI00391B47C5
METNTIAEFDAKFRTNELLVAQNAHWRWSVRAQQCTLGATILSATREYQAWPEMQPDEAIGLQAILKTIGAALEVSFSPDKLNYLMLMMVDSHVHFHILPRYASERHFGGAIWTDSTWPAAPNLMKAAPIDDGQAEIRERLKAAVTASELPS